MMTETDLALASELDKFKKLTMLKWRQISIVEIRNIKSLSFKINALKYKVQGIYNNLKEFKENYLIIFHYAGNNIFWGCNGKKV